MVGHAGSRLLTDLAEATGLEFGFADALASLRQRAGGHGLGRSAVDLAATLADGGEAISDLAALRDQAELFGPVASDPKAWRVLESIDAAAIARLRGTRAVARDLAWAQCADTRGALPQAKAAGRVIPGQVLDINASIVICHSEKQNATGAWKKTLGYHPLPCRASWTTAARPWRAPCAQGGPGRTRQPITLRCSTPPSRRSRTSTARHPPSWSGRTPPVHARVPQAHQIPARTRRGRALLSRRPDRRAYPPGDHDAAGRCVVPGDLMPIEDRRGCCSRPVKSGMS